MKLAYNPYNHDTKSIKLKCDVCGSVDTIEFSLWDWESWLHDSTTMTFAEWAGMNTEQSIHWEFAICPRCQE